MKILMFSMERTLVGGDYSGDAVRRHQEYAKAVDELHIIVFSKKGYLQKKLSPNLTVYPTNSTFRFLYFWDAYKIAKKIIKRSDRHQISERLIVTQEPFSTGLAGWLTKKKFKIPFLVHFHGDFWDNSYWLKENFLNPIFLFLSKFLVRRADAIRVVSSGIKAKLLRKGISENKIRVISTPVNIGFFDSFDPSKVARIKKNNQNKKTIINVARRDRAKDYPTLFDAVKYVAQKYPGLAFWQFGADYDLKKEIKNLDKSVALKSTAKIDHEELKHYYYASDVYVSSSSQESFGKVLVEAMVCGLPVVATATTGSKEIIREGENGFLVPIGDSRALADKIIYLLKNPGVAKAMGEKGRAMVSEKFDGRKNTQKIINFWKDIISNSK